MSGCCCGTCNTCGGWQGRACFSYERALGITFLLPPPSELDAPPCTTEETEFGWFRELLRSALHNPGFIAANTAMQNEAFVAELDARLDALGPSMDQTLTLSDVVLTSPRTVTKDEGAQILRVRGTSYARVLALPDVTVTRPSDVWIRTPTSEEPAPYIVADAETGVLFLTPAGTVARRLDGFNAAGPTAGYRSVTSARTWVRSGTEVMALVMPETHVVRLVNPLTGAAFSTIGVWNNAGVTPSLLTRPVAVAIHAASGVMVIASAGGTDPGATGPGFLSAFDVTNPAAPAPLGILALCLTNGSLARREVQDPRGLWTEGDTLWVSNGSPAEVASFPFPSSTLAPSTRYFGPDSFPEISWSNLGAPSVRVPTSGPKVLSVPDGTNGQIVTVRLDRNAVRAIYRTRWLQDDFRAPAALPRASTPTCAVPDERVVGGVLQRVLWVTDRERGVVMTMADDQDTTFHPSHILFRPLSFPVPVRIAGYAVQGTLPANVVRVSVKRALTEPWREIDREHGLPGMEPTTYVHVRVTLNVPYGDQGDGYTLKAIRLLLDAA